MYDGLGSVVAEVNSSGTVTSNRKYDVFGSVRGGSNPSGTSKQKFVGNLGHISDDETGYVYMRARYMDPITGRFVSQDPARNGSNWFAYASNAPTTKVDATGKEADFYEFVCEFAALILEMEERSIGRAQFCEWVDTVVAPYIETQVSPRLTILIVKLFKGVLFDAADADTLITEAELIIQNAKNAQIAEQAVGLGAKAVSEADEAEADESVAGL